jgi:hypothetical protein
MEGQEMLAATAVQRTLFDDRALKTKNQFIQTAKVY